MFDKSPCSWMSCVCCICADEAKEIVHKYGKLSLSSLQSLWRHRVPLCLVSAVYLVCVCIGKGGAWCRTFMCSPRKSIRSCIIIQNVYVQLCTIANKNQSINQSTEMSCLSFSVSLLHLKAINAPLGVCPSWLTDWILSELYIIVIRGQQHADVLSEWVAKLKTVRESM